jgi:hypothetical protein
MTCISLTLPEISQSVTRPVIFDIISQVQNNTKISPDTIIKYPGDIDRMQTPGSDIGSQDPTARFNAQRYTFIEVEEDYDHDTLGSTAVAYNEHIPVWLDRALGVEVKPVYATSAVTISFKYRCPSKTEALRWRDDIRIRISQMQDLNLHHITYHYQLPVSVYEVLVAVYQNREAYLGYGETIDQYIWSNASTRMTLVSDRVDQSARLAISETQSRIVGLYGFDGIPDRAERDDTAGAWQISFQYRFSYEKPIACHMRYPIMVHNALLPARYIAFTNSEPRPDRIPSSFSRSIGALHRFEMPTQSSRTRDWDYLIRLPAFDDYIPTQIPPGTGSLILALAEVDETDDRTLFNLSDLGEYVLDADIMEFITESEYPYICDLYKSIISVTLYRNAYLTSFDTIRCASDLTLRATRDLNLRNQHRVRIALVTDLTLLDPAALDRLRLYPKALVKILSALNELLGAQPDFVRYADKSCVSILEFNPIFKFLTGYDCCCTDGEYRYNIDPRYRGNDGYGDLFRGIHADVIDQFRRFNVGHMTVMATGIIALRTDPT